MRNGKPPTEPAIGIDPDVRAQVVAAAAAGVTASAWLTSAAAQALRGSAGFGASGEELAPTFDRMMRGYDIGQTDLPILHFNAALAAGSPAELAAAAQVWRSAQLRPKVRGYSRLQVDNYIMRRLAGMA